jgi:uncharacterized cupredoxin-like copper-binding protein/Cu/Ag efflux protein CusF
MNHPATTFAPALALALALSAPLARAAGTHAGGHGESAIGEPGKAARVTRTVRIDMSDAMRFSPASIDARQGETIRFIVKNSGKLKHELVLGTEKDLHEHAEVMKKNPEMEHADPNMVTVAPGKSGQVIWRFSKAGRVDFACLQPGHYDAGMKGLVNVAAGKGAAILLAQATTPPGTVDSPKTDSAAADSEMSDGEVRKIDKDSKKITLKHGEIKNLDMPGMTMVFQVKDPSLLDKVQVGGKVKFKAVKEDGKFMVTEIQPVP